MKNFSVFGFAFAMFALMGCAPSSFVRNGPHGPEMVQKTNLLGGTDTVENTGPTYEECRQNAAIDPRYMPMDKYLACRSMASSVGGAPGGYPMMGGGYGMMPYVMVTPGQAAMMQTPGGAAVIAGPTPQVYPPNAGTTTSTTGAPSGEYATKADVKVLGSAVVKTQKDVCVLNKKNGLPCK